jgi:arylsulfatase A
MITRRQFLSSATAASVLRAASAARRSPNFVILFADDQGYGDVGAFGATGYQTPNLDRMAREGMKFTSFYVAAPVCTPSRAALMTGCHPMRVGLDHRVLFPYSKTGLNPDEITIAEVLKTQGYSTACIGKWHLGHHPKFLPTRQGFDYYFGIPYSNDMGDHYYQQQHFKAPPLPLMRNEELIEQSPDQRYLTRRYTDEAVRFITKNKDRLFFLYLPHNMPHRPIAASEKFKGKTAYGLYGDVVEEIDWSAGQVLSTIKKLGLDNDTLVVFTSDNGPVIWEGLKFGYRSGSAGPLRGNKNTTWEGGMREPCIMRWPGKIPSGAVCDELTSTMDMLPTLAKLAGTQAPTDRIIDGKDIWPLMSGKPGAKSPHKAFYYYRDERLQAVRSGRWKLHVYRPEGGAPLLYDLETDLGETTNVAGQHPDVVKRLQALAEEAREDLGDAVFKRQGKNVRPVGRL